MAAPASPEAIEIRRRGRQRLIGAIALVLLLVVFVPMILDSQPRTERPAPAAIPSRENAPPLPVPSPRPPDVAGKPQAGVKPPDAPPEAAPKTAEVKPAVPKRTDAKPAAPKAAAASPRLEGFAVQVGAFRDEAHLTEAREKLAAAGVVHYTERLDSQGGALTRLRAGPFPTREAAEAAAAKLKRASLEGKVVPLP